MSYEKRLLETFYLDFPKNLTMAERRFFFKRNGAGVRDHDQLNVDSRGWS